MSLIEKRERKLKTKINLKRKFKYSLKNMEIQECIIMKFNLMMRLNSMMKLTDKLMNL